MTTTTLKSNYTYSANIIGYNAATKAVLLDNPINISLGKNNIYGDVTSQYSIDGTYENPLSAINAGGVAKLSTDENGNFVGIFNVPSGIFQTGQRVFRVDNRTVLTDQTTATTYSEATFTASGLHINAQQNNFSPAVDSGVTTFAQSSQTIPSISTISTYSPFDPTAQTFIVSKENYPNGIFINDVKLFFAGVPNHNVPIQLSIVGTLNGYPNGKVLDYSTVILNTDQVNISSTPHYLDSTTYTQFTFQAPVYIQSGVLYAIMIQSSSPDYTLYYAQQNQFAIPTTAKALPTDPNPTNPTKIGTSPYVGALFESQNAITWTADQTKDLMFVIDQCIFDITKQPSIPFVVGKYLPYRKLNTKDILYKDNAGNVSGLSGNFSRKNTLFNALNVTTTDFIPTSTNINYQYVATLYSDLSQTSTTPIIPGKFGTPKPDNVYLNDQKGSRVLLAKSNNSFALYASLSSSDKNISPIISDDGVSLYALKYHINNMGIGNNVISVVNGGSGYNGNTLNLAQVIVTSQLTQSNTVSDLGTTAATFGITANSTGSITNVYMITPGSGYITSPTITIVDPTTRGGNSNAVIIIHGETGPSGGNSYAKYFTKKVILNSGNDSGDLRVYYTAYQPLGTAVYIYYKILSSSDTSIFENQNWQLMTPTTNINTYSTSRTDLIEYECAPGIWGSGLANNNISYVSTNGQSYNSFIQFAIKVVMATTDNTNVPFLTDIRALALPSGTGL